MVFDRITIDPRRVNERRRDGPERQTARRSRERARITTSEVDPDRVSGLVSTLTITCGG